VAVAAGAVLLAVLLCDYYYFFYTVLTGCLIFGWQAIQKKDPFFFLKRGYLLSFAVFFVTSIIVTAPLVISLLLLNASDPILGAHNSKEFSLDLLAPFIPGGHWRFADLTQPFWSKLPGNIHESSVYIGVSVLFLLIYVWIKRRNVQVQGLRLWYFILLFFAILSLGPVLHIWGREISFIRLPYALFVNAFPPLAVSGMPVRMIVMVTLSASVICSVGFKMLLREGANKKLLAALLLAILFVESLPTPMPATKLPIPGYVNILKNLPGNEGLIDEITSPPFALYYQTIHEKPMVAFGYLSRVPKSVSTNQDELIQIIANKKYFKLYDDYGIRYFITDANVDTLRDYPQAKILYQDSQVKLYDLK